MKKIIGLGVLLAALYYFKDFYRFSAFNSLINIAFIILLIYLLVVVLQFIKNYGVNNNTSSVGGVQQNETKPGSGVPWFIGFIVIAVFIFLFREILGRNSFKVFIVLDNLVKFGQSLPPFVGWVLPGLFVGAVYGSVVAWRKYKLHYSINLFPIAALIIVGSLLVLINDPFSNEFPDRIINQTAPGSESSTDGLPQKLLLNRWKIVDITGKNKKNLLQRNNKMQSEIEFKDNGKCYLYENNVTTNFVNYTIDADGRTIRFTDPRKKDETTEIEIISISKDEMKLRSQLFNNEIATLRVK